MLLMLMLVGPMRAHTTHHMSNVPGMCGNAEQFVLNTPPNNNNAVIMPSGPPRSAL